MIYEPTVSEEYDLGLCLYYYKCALDAENQDAAKSQFQGLAKIILKAMSSGRMDSDARAVFNFLVTYPDLYVLVKQTGSGLRDLIFTAHEQAPYGPGAAEALRMYYDR